MRTGRPPTHGHTKGLGRTPEYRAWMSMIKRCDSKRDVYWKYYGARGITVCERWRSFENFLADMGQRPDCASLDRIDNDAGYVPENCRWSNPKEQAQNRRSTRSLTFMGQTKCVSDWASSLGMRIGTLFNRLDVCHWSIEKSLTTPVEKRARR